MERRRPRKSSRHSLRPKSKASNGGGRTASSSSVNREAVQPNGVSPIITSLLGGRLNRVARLTKAPQILRVTENPDGEGLDGVQPQDERDSGQSEDSEVSPGIVVNSMAASPRGSAVHGHLMAFAGPRESDSPRISVEVPEVFSTSSRTTSTVGNLRFGPEGRSSSAAGGINFGANSYYDKNSYVYDDEGEDEDDDEDRNRLESQQNTGACYSAWAQLQNQPTAGHVGRDTLGFAIHLGTATMSHNRCAPGISCDDDCGYGTGCDAGCSEVHGIPPGSFMVPLVPGGSRPGSGRANGPFNTALRGPVGPPPPTGFSGQRGSFGVNFGSDQLNFFVTFLLEVLGVLVFFAICTITFWITLGYHVVQLLVDLKNAERNVQVAVAIVFGLLFLAFAISQVTNRTGFGCHGRDRGRYRAKGGCPFYRSTKSTAKSKPRSFFNKPKSSPQSKTKSKKGTNDGGGCRRMCGAKLELHSHRKQRYTDCEGRAIFLNARRYAIPTEMKQPPTIVLWLRDVLARMMQ
ncbi:uncharacterized protein LOC128264412 [Drosophila gunungcola]|uniref:Uncharacterized protein n=1 Tax=Drosophila gunungcola TaxID=103775 RepID=A0A9Q0BJU1_9MUSC|nr:uncharacterized protein LOC128264412 [Drosophila gunungcola]KAI8034521.1 hypothetical protein M5D96_012708 [Drosophila gunungcola]